MSYSTGNTNYKSTLDQIIEMRFGNAKISKALEEAAAYAESVTKARAKFKSGELREGIHADVMADNTVGLFSDAPHSLFVNSGTYKMQGDHFFDYGVNELARKLNEVLRAL